MVILSAHSLDHFELVSVINQSAPHSFNQKLKTEGSFFVLTACETVYYNG